MKKSIITICFLVLCWRAFAQSNSTLYHELIDQADSLYEAKDYKNAAFTFSSAFKIAITPPTIGDRWTAAGSWSRSKFNDSAFSQLNFIANAKGLTYSRAVEILRDEDFAELRKDDRWQIIKNSMYLASYTALESDLKENGALFLSPVDSKERVALALGNNEEDAFVHLNNDANYFLKAKNFNRAYRLFRVSINHFPPNYILYTNMVDYHKAIGDKEKAFIYFSRAEVVKYKKPDTFSDTTVKIDSLLKSEYSEFSNSIGRKIQPPEYLVSQTANELLRRGRTDKAFDLFKMNIENHPNSFSAYREMGNLFDKKGDKVTAGKYFSKAFIVQYKLPVSFFDSAFNVKEYIQKHYEDLLKQKGDRVFFSETFFNNIGDYFLSNKSYEKAEVLFQTNMDKYSQSLNVYNKLSLLYKTTGDKVREDSFRRKALALKTIYQQKGISGSDVLPDTIFNIQVTLPVCNTGCPTILLQNNGRWSGGIYKPFANLMANDGYRVILNKDPITKQLLSQTNVLVIAGDRIYRDEIGNINEWVRQGGALLAITHHDETWFDEFLLSLGVQTNEVTITSDSVRGLAPDGLSASWGYTVFSENEKLLGINPIIRGRINSETVKMVKTFGGGRSIVGPPGSSALLLLGKTADDYMPIDPTRPVQSRVPFKSKGLRTFGTAFTLGKGRIVVFSAAPALTAALFPPSWTKIGMNNPGSDNKQFALNIMRWLTGYLK